MSTGKQTNESYADQIRRAARLPSVAEKRPQHEAKIRNQKDGDDHLSRQNTLVDDYQTRVLGKAMETVAEINEIINDAPFFIHYSDYPKIFVAPSKILIENLFVLTMKNLGPLKGRPAPSLVLALYDDGTVIAAIIGTSAEGTIQLSSDSLTSIHTEMIISKVFLGYLAVASYAIMIGT